MKTILKALLILPALYGDVAWAQSNYDYETTCRMAAANRLNVSKDRVTSQLSGWSSGRAHVVWRYSRQNGYCVVDNRMNVVEFKDLATGGGYGGGYDRPGNGIYRVAVDTSGRGNFNGNNMSVRITRGWVDTTGQPSISFSGDGNFKITFRGDVVRANGDLEYSIRITSSDRGSASGTATFRFNNDRNEVEYISANGRLNGRSFSGNFNR